VSFDLRDQGYTRQERPAIRSDGALVEVAWLASGSDGTAVFRTKSLDGGATWAWPSEVGDAFPHVGPAWEADGALVWTRPGAELCRLPPGGTASCDALGSPRVGSLAVGNEVLVTLDVGVGQWEVSRL
jgi:hypothetical protein